MDPSLPPGPEDVLEARERLRLRVHRTPVVTCATLDRLSGSRLFFKAENLQKVGAFKFRGATHAVELLDEASARRGVATHSSGNHAQALSLAARERGIPAHIVMPVTAPAVKRRAVEGYGGQITDCEPELESRETTLAGVLERTGATFVHPFNDARVIAGQGTAALELLDEVPDLDVLLVPVGGGGLLAGTALAVRTVSNSPRVLGAEPELAADAHRSLEKGEIQPPDPPRTVADGLLTCLGDLTFAIIREAVSEIRLVTEAEIIAATRLLWERAKLIVEPSGAVPLAAALRDDFPHRGARIGIILSGGNVDLDRLPWMSSSPPPSR